MAEWSRLSPDLVLLIAERLETRFDILRLRSVCSSWRSFVSPKLYPPLPSHLPWFVPGILPSILLSITTNTLYLIKFSHAPSTACWLAKIRHGANGVETALLNPLSNSEFNLESPMVFDVSNFQVFELGHENIGQHTYSQMEFLGIDYQKMVLLRPSSTGIDSNDFIMLGRNFRDDSSCLTVLRSGEEGWSQIEDVNNVRDMISFNGKVYAIDGEGRTIVIDQSLNVSFLERVGSDSLEDNHVFLVKAVDKLLFVEMFFLPGSNNDDTVYGFRVLRMNEKHKKWEMESLEERILFLNLQQSFSAPSSEFGWGKGNLIFYSKHLSDYPSGDYEDEPVCVYDLVTGTTSSLDNYPLFRNLFWPPPQWVTAPESVISSTQVVRNSADSITSAKRRKIDI